MILGCPDRPVYRGDQQAEHGRQELRQVSIRGGAEWNRSGPIEPPRINSCAAGPRPGCPCASVIDEGME